MNGAGQLPHEPQNFIELLRERARKGQPNGDDLVILTGTEAVEIATEIEKLEADLSCCEKGCAG